MAIELKKLMQGYIPRSPYVVDASPQSNSLKQLYIEEAAIRVVSPQHRNKRRTALGAPVWEHPLRAAAQFIADVRIGPEIEMAHRIVGGARHFLAETAYGINHERAKLAGTPHDGNHIKRLTRLVETMLIQPESKIKNPDLFTMATLWVTNHDAEQLNREVAGIAETKWGHDYAGAIHAKMQQPFIRAEAGMSEDRARFIAGATSALMYCHDEPAIHQRILDAIERDDSLKPYKEFETVVDGKTTRMRRYMNASEVIANLENQDTNAARVDLLALPDWLQGAITKAKLSKKGFVTTNTPFGLDAVFEHDFAQALDAQFNTPPEGATVDAQGHVIIPATIGEEHSLVPQRLLNATTRIEIAHMGDMLRLADFFDMTPPGLGLVRKLQVPMNWIRPLFRPGVMESITTKGAKLPPEEDNIYRRSVYELVSLLSQIQRRPGQLRPALADNRYIRDTAYRLFELGIDALNQIMPILMSGNKAAIRAELSRILTAEHTKMEKKINVRSTSELNKSERLRAEFEQIERQVDNIMTHMDAQFISYSGQDIAAVLLRNNTLLQEASRQYRQAYGARRTSPGRPYKTWNSLPPDGNLAPAGSLENVRTIQKHAGYGN